MRLRKPSMLAAILKQSDLSAACEFESRLCKSIACTAYGNSILSVDSHAVLRAVLEATEEEYSAQCDFQYVQIDNTDAWYAIPLRDDWFASVSEGSMFLPTQATGVLHDSQTGKSTTGHVRDNGRKKRTNNGKGCRALVKSGASGRKTVQKRPPRTSKIADKGIQSWLKRGMPKEGPDTKMRPLRVRFQW